MASPQENVSMAVFCDFENVALGVRDAKYEKFDIKPVLERLLLKGSIVVKKAYCDWDRYKGFKDTMHEANFELIEIPHIRQSGKNSADIRLVVDALDLCYTKSHVNTFVIISGDSDFSPLVSKLRENAKQVIGVGVKQSTSDLLIANCDEFIFYDDLVRESQRAAAKRDTREAQPAAKRSPDEERRRKEELEARKSKAIEIAVETFEALVSERGDSGKIWASTLKQAIKRRKPDFNESYYGFRAFGNLLEEAQARGLLELGRDEKSGTYVYRSPGGKTGGETGGGETAAGPTPPETRTDSASAEDSGKHAAPRRRREGRKSAQKNAVVPQETSVAVDAQAATEPSAQTPTEETAAQTKAETTVSTLDPPGRKPSARARRPRKQIVTPDQV
ncbi:NYN domain-containing protein [Nitrosovibrio tenuis]|nr:NYN domain-containing protein [Nitrosovibrio tenuis]